MNNKTPSCPLKPPTHQPAAPDMTPVERPDPSETMAQVATAIVEFVDAIHRWLELNDAVLTLASNKKDVDIFLFQTKVLRTCDQVEKLVNPGRHPFQDEARSTLLGQCLQFQSYQGQTQLLSAAFEMLTSYDDVLEQLGVGQAISTGKSPDSADSKIPFDAFIWASFIVRPPGVESIATLSRAAKLVLRSSA
jgi:hypothetical protein